MDPRVAKLKWRCRRGMRELDAVLTAFLEAEGPRFADADIGCFEGILELPDPTLHAYLLGRSVPADASAAALIERIRASHRPAS
ncbi:MAG TPA: succinate dehydrogenase assembly factor 2 [Gammaproteobacteria bacterium]|jgi:antitoxin CptB|nr:succinate dehydrogenase assembly factor 2 [Gammaproteobacteria bacterium]